jgi:predicted GNAT superfamily acetyltransferase
MNITVRILESPEEFERAEEVQMSAWGMTPRMATPKEVMIAINDNGGFVLGAFDEGKQVGFALTLLGRAEDRLYMYSHMTGVSREYQSKGVGYLLKQKQKEVSLERGFDLVAWTFDPIISLNAHFNLTKLGVVARNYFPDYYGPMHDSINFGWPTDRFLCEWYVKPEKQKEIRALAKADLEKGHVAIRKGGRDPYSRCLDWDVDLNAELVLVDIPSDVAKLKASSMEDGKRWRLGTREVFQKYFAAGFTAVALLEDDGFRYLLRRVELPENVFAHGRSSHPR